MPLCAFSISAWPGGTQLTSGAETRRMPGTGTWFAKAWRWVGVALVVVWIIIPFLVTISASLKTRGAVFSDPSIIPDAPTVESYRAVLARPGFRSAFWNSMILGVGTTCLTLLLAVPAA